MKDLEAFKNKILFSEIHQAERDGKLYEMTEAARFKLTYYKHRELDTIKIEDTEQLLPVFFDKTAMQIVNYEYLILLCKDLQNKKYVSSQYWINSTDDYNQYIDYFKKNIASAKKILVKLRPHMLEYCQTWTAKRKQMDIDKPEIGHFYKDWYITGKEPATIVSSSVADNNP